MVLGLGFDLAELDRISRSLERFGDRFLERVLTPGEQRFVPTAPASRVAYVAARFAAKEAASKALGTGFTQGIGLHDLEVGRMASGQPYLCLHGQAAVRAAELGVTRSHLSLTHSRTTAGAVVVLERELFDV